MSQHNLVDTFEKFVRKRYLKEGVRVTLESSSVTKKTIKITMADDFASMGFAIERELIEGMLDMNEQEVESDDDDDEEKEEPPKKKLTKRK